MIVLPFCNAYGELIMYKKKSLGESVYICFNWL